MRLLADVSRAENLQVVLNSIGFTSEEDYWIVKIMPDGMILAPSDGGRTLHLRKTFFHYFSFSSESLQIVVRIQRFMDIICSCGPNDSVDISARFDQNRRLHFLIRTPDFQRRHEQMEGIDVIEPGPDGGANDCFKIVQWPPQINRELCRIKLEKEEFEKAIKECLAADVQMELQLKVIDSTNAQLVMRSYSTTPPHEFVQELKTQIPDIVVDGLIVELSGVMPHLSRFMKLADAIDGMRGSFPFGRSIFLKTLTPAQRQHTSKTTSLSTSLLFVMSDSAWLEIFI